MSAPVGSPEWQAAMNEAIEQHDREARESGNDNQNFEIGQR